MIDLDFTGFISASISLLYFGIIQIVLFSCFLYVCIKKYPIKKICLLGGIWILHLLICFLLVREPMLFGLPNFGDTLYITRLLGLGSLIVLNVLLGKRDRWWCYLSYGFLVSCFLLNAWDGGVYLYVSQKNGFTSFEEISDYLIWGQRMGTWVNISNRINLVFLLILAVAVICIPIYNLVKNIISKRQLRI